MAKILPFNKDVKTPEIPPEIMAISEREADGLNWIYDPLANRRKMKVLKRSMDRQGHWVYVLTPLR